MHRCQVETVGGSTVQVLVPLAANGSPSSPKNRVPAIKSSLNGPTALALDINGHLQVIEGGKTEYTALI